MLDWDSTAVPYCLRKRECPTEFPCVHILNKHKLLSISLFAMAEEKGNSVNPTTRPGTAELALLGAARGSGAKSDSFAHVDAMLPQNFKVPEGFEETAGLTWSQMSKRLQGIKLPPMPTSDEIQYEFWAQEVLQICIKSKLNFELGKELMVDAFNDAKTFTPLPLSATTFEELKNDMARILFPVGRPFYKLQREIETCPRATSIEAIYSWLFPRLAAYVSIGRRHGNVCTLSEEGLTDLFLNALPRDLYICVEDKDPQPFTWTNVNRIAIRAEKIRANAERESSGVYAVETAAPADDETRKRRREDEPMKKDAKNVGNCFSCGGSHFRKDCEYRNARCRQCQKIGHIQAVCRNFVIKDENERIRAGAVNKTTGTEFFVKSDATQKDQLGTVDNVLSRLMDKVKRAQETSKNRREKKKREAGWTRKRKVVDHPVMAVEEKISDDLATLAELLVDTFDREETESSDEVAAADTAAVVGSAVTAIRVPAKIAGKEISCIADSGAGYCIMPKDVVEELGLKRVGGSMRFAGLGTRTGYLLEPVDVTVGSRTICVNFYEADLQCRPLLGVEALRKFNFVVDVSYNRLLDADDYAVIATGEETAPADAVLIENSRQGPEDLIYQNSQTLSVLLSAVPESIRAIVLDIFLENRSCWESPQIGKASVQVTLTPIGKPVRQRLRPVNEVKKAALDSILTKLLEKGVIRESDSQWGSNVVLVPKSNGSWRLCVDYRDVNKVLKFDSYPIPHLVSGLQRICHASVFCTIDLESGFWNLPLCEDSKEVTTFLTHRGTFEFNVLPFGLNKSPGAFQRLMDRVFSDFDQHEVFIYVDDIVIAARTIDDGCKLLNKVLQRLCEHGLFININKVNLFQSKVRVLGHVVGGGGISADPEKVRAIQDAKPPTDRSTLRSFLGMAGYLRKFTPFFAEIAAPLTALMKKKAKWTWGSAQSEAFEHLKLELAQKVMLSAPCGNGPFAILTDASDVGIGAALFQEQNGELVLLECASKRLTDTERRWDVREREAYAIKYSLEKFRDYLAGSEVEVYSDHESLRWMDKSDVGKVQRWSLFIQQFRVKIFHLPGLSNDIADFLSRSPVDDEETERIVEKMKCPYAAAADGSAPPAPATMRYDVPSLPRAEHFQEAYKSIPDDEQRDIVKGIDKMYYHVHTRRLYIPPPLRDAMIFWFHASRFGGHAGINRCLRRMKCAVWWPRMASDVRDFVNKCLLCAMNAPLPRLPSFRGILSRPQLFQLISLDFVGPHSWGSLKVNFVVIIDHASRFVFARPVPGHTTDQAIQVLREFWVPTFGAPQAILCDNGSAFKANQFKEFVLVELSAALIFTSPYYPQGNAINESCHQSLNRSLKLASSQHADDFPTCLADAVAVHNAIPHSSTGFSPYCMLFGDEPVFPGWQRLKPRTTRRLRGSVRREARHRQMIRHALEVERQVVDSREFKEDDWIVHVLGDYEKMKSTSSGENGISAAYDANWSLPCKVLEVSPHTLVVAELGYPATKRQVPRSQVRLLQGPVPPVLVDLNIEAITALKPRYIRHRSGGPSRAVDWSEIVDKSATAGGKRARGE